MPLTSSCALAAGLIALEIRFAGWPNRPLEYLVFTAFMPILWVSSVAVARGYEPRFVGVGPDEFRKVLNVGASLTAAVAIISFVTKSDDSPRVRSDRTALRYRV